MSSDKVSKVILPRFFRSKPLDDKLEEMVVEYAVVPPSDNNWIDGPFYMIMMRRNAPESLCRLYCETKYPSCDAEKIGNTSDGRSYYALKLKKGYSVH